jgi:lipoprotein NlpD
MNFSIRSSQTLLSLMGLAVIAACSSAHRPAPVEDRSVQGRAAAPVSTPSASAAPVDAGKTQPGAENAGKPGYYIVQRGDSLTRIGLEHGQSWRDLARWNNISNPDVIEVGQVVRVSPPGSAVEASGVVVRPVASNAPSTAPTVAATNAPTAAATNAQSNAQPTPAQASPVAKPVPPAPAAVADDMAVGWPASGNVIAGFDEVKNKGLDIAGKAGDVVLAAADGQVVYAGAGLRGYGNLVILKHNNTYLTAYAHNQKLLVKEDQKVRKGEKIAEMGNSDADRVKLHFEVRRQGKPVDPAKFLAAR